jgi:hypothetical protein
MFQWLRDWLASADPACNANLIFVLAGLPSRKSFALDLFQSRLAPRILFSVGRYEIRRFASFSLPQQIDLLEMAQSVPPPLRHYFVYFADQKFEVQRILASGFGTMREIDALAQWLEARPDITSLLIVSSGFHLRRLRLCCRVLLHRNLNLHFLAVPGEIPPTYSADGHARRQVRKVVLEELAKIFCYSLVLPLRRIVLDLLRKRSQTLNH